MNAENVQEYLFNNSAPCDTNFRDRFPVIQARCAKCGVMREVYKSMAGEYRPVAGNDCSDSRHGTGCCGEWVSFIIYLYHPS